MFSIVQILPVWGVRVEHVFFKNWFEITFRYTSEEVLSYYANIAKLQAVARVLLLRSASERLVTKSVASGLIALSLLSA